VLAEALGDSESEDANEKRHGQSVNQAEYWVTVNLKRKCQFSNSGSEDAYGNVIAYEQEIAMVTVNKENTLFYMHPCALTIYTKSDSVRRRLGSKVDQINTCTQNSEQQVLTHRPSKRANV
jgi:hypothetical protein